MKSKLVGTTITNNEDHVRLRIFDGAIPLDEAGQELLALERAHAKDYHSRLVAALNENEHLKRELADLRGAD